MASTNPGIEEIERSLQQVGPPPMFQRESERSRNEKITLYLGSLDRVMRGQAQFAGDSKRAEVAEEALHLHLRLKKQRGAWSDDAIDLSGNISDLVESQWYGRLRRFEQVWTRIWRSSFAAEGELYMPPDAFVDANNAVSFYTHTKIGKDGQNERRLLQLRQNERGNYSGVDVRCIYDEFQTSLTLRKLQEDGHIFFELSPIQAYVLYLRKCAIEQADPIKDGYYVASRSIRLIRLLHRSGIVRDDVYVWI